MDNQNKIKFKETGSKDWFEKIDLLTGQKISFPKTHGYYKEMLAWVAAENEIEPQYTEEELAEKEAQAVISAQETVNATARTFLNESGSGWKVSRHRDQLANGDPTSLTDTEYLTLLTDRQEARDSVVEP